MTYMNDTNYSIRRTNDKFRIVDRNGELLSDKRFDNAALAIDYAFKHFSESKLLSNTN